MEWVPVVLLVLGLPVVLVIWLIVRAVTAKNRLDDLDLRLIALQDELTLLRRSLKRGEFGPVAEKPEPEPTPAEASAGLDKIQERLRALRQSAETPPVISPAPAVPLTPSPVAAPVAAMSSAEPAAAPPVIPESTTFTPKPEPGFVDKFDLSKINWEQFVGVKLLMWLGGFAAFLTVVFAVKYSFDRNWITPELRVAAGFLCGLGMLVAGTLLHRRQRYLVGAQTFCATGIVILYATTFACRSIYHFEFFGLVPTFLLMALITTTAFVLAVRLDALVVAILGICGGFLTPMLLSTGQDNPFGLFGYIVLLDCGLLAVAIRKRWDFLALMGAAGTLLMQLGWVGEFFEREKYFLGTKTLIPFAVFLGFSVLFVAVWSWVHRRQEDNRWLTVSAIAMPAVALLFGFFVLDYPPIGQRPGLLFAFILLADLCLLSLVWQEVKLNVLQLAAGAATFLLLTIWTVEHLSAALLNWGLGLYLVFAVLHSAIPWVMQRLQPRRRAGWWGHLFPPLALLLMLGPIIKLHTGSLLIWPFVLLLDLVVLLLALLSASVAWILGALVLTLLLAGVWIGQAQSDLSMLPNELFVIGGFAIFFFAAGIFVARRLGLGGPKQSAGEGQPSDAFTLPSSDQLAQHVPAFSAVLPFVLLIMVTLKLPLRDPSPVFGLALLLVGLLLGLTRLFPISWFPAVGLVCVLGLEHAWHFHHFNAETASIPLLWYLGFTVLFAGFPFLLWRRLKDTVVPWATAALSGPAHFYIVHRLVKAAWPNPYMGLLPAAFAIPSIFGLIFLIRALRTDAPRRNTLLALFGAAALFFITLIFPIQFERQWITIGWALEGVALLWLFHRVPHNGLRMGGVALLVTAFARLALNPVVLHYHARSATPILNWYLYAYGLTTACLFMGVVLLRPPHHMLLRSNVRALLGTLGTILGFVLLNIEIADYFTRVGQTALTFEFSGNLARDMTYSIAWAAFALVLVVAGIGWKIPAARFAGIALLGVTLLKVFLHDLANLQALYRIGALLGVAIIAMAASFLYQRFFAVDAPRAEPKIESKPPPTAAV